MNSLTAFVTLMGAVSVASERVVEILKGMIPPLATELKGNAEAFWRAVAPFIGGDQFPRSRLSASRRFSAQGTMVKDCRRTRTDQVMVHVSFSWRPQRESVASLNFIERPFA